MLSLQSLTNVSKQNGTQKVADNVPCESLKSSIRYCFRCILLAVGTHNSIRHIKLSRFGRSEFENSLEDITGIEAADGCLNLGFILDRWRSVYWVIIQIDFCKFNGVRVVFGQNRRCLLSVTKTWQETAVTERLSSLILDC